MTTVSASWDAAAELPTVLEAQSPSSVVHGLAFSALPLVLARPVSPDAQQTPCELALQWPAQPLRCRQFKLEIVCSARHVELFIDGVRRSLLGEDEQGEVYLGTFRGAKQSGAPTAAGEQFFAISEEFMQRESKTNILKEMHRLRVKFVSLTGDKSTLQVKEFKCAYVPLQLYEHPAPAAAPSPAAPIPTPSPGASLEDVDSSSDSSPQPQAPAAAPTSSFAAHLAGLSLNGGGLGGASLSAGAFSFGDVAAGGMDTQVIMKGFQQMLEREMETKIMKAVDAKLAKLSQRLTFTEQRLFQLHQQVEASGSGVQATLAQIKQQLAQLESQVKLSQQSQSQLQRQEEETQPLIDESAPASDE